ncbi:5-formyltetrahydrofolate cyclo-ligase family protein [Caprobacter fermentans]|uniref:5-formyltetrahydrofolate cyclo-ligase n=1 Tax=Caproicibacter fermentans TaxID=2576756 RepID=A0A6N8I1I5_9FIRM|nr:5-formyltetrahydrofolate cyclo-ligase [Caproicibacter fermentans]MVB11587.1 5-formyltetrahydrofolate cyclo-ligase family protein [Caproicibacter fermentans]
MKNIKEIKKNLRAQFRQYRERMNPEKKSKYDAAILDRFLSLREYESARTVFTYVSKPIEVDTTELIRSVLALEREVAVPLCLPETCGMQFYKISSLEELIIGTYGVLEPDPERNAPVQGSENSICIVPGLSFDSQGYRLGYGKGYYDRFLSDFKGLTVGLCYTGCLKWNLPHGYYDKPVDILITEKYIRRISAKKA